MNDDTLVTALERCWAFPPQFSSGNGVKMAAGTEVVLQSLQVLFMTQTGERIMRESWGASMNDFLFANITDELLAKIQTRIEETILRYESRVTLKDIIIQPAADEASRLRVAITVYLSDSDMTEVVSGTLDLNEGHALRIL